MNRALVLACGNPQRGDDGVALHIAKFLENSSGVPEMAIRFQQQWTPELAEPISESEIVVFVDSSGDAVPGTIAYRQIQPSPRLSPGLSHHCSPESLLALAKELYGKQPARAYLVTVCGVSFALSEVLSEPVRQAIPRAVEIVTRVSRERP